MLRILVCFQVVPEVEHLLPAEVRSIAAGKESLTQKRRSFDVYDEAALEAALRLRDQALATNQDISLTAVTVGQCDARFFQRLFTIHFDEVAYIPCNHLQLFQPERVAVIISEYMVSKDGFDVILMGQQSSLGGNALTPHIIATRQGIPSIANVIDLELIGAAVQVTRQTDSGISSAVLTVPVVLAFGNARHPYLRLATLRETMKSTGKSASTAVSGAFTPRMAVPQLEGLTSWVAEKQCHFIEGTSASEKTEVLWRTHIGQLVES